MPGGRKVALPSLWAGKLQSWVTRRSLEHFGSLIKSNPRPKPQVCVGDRESRGLRASQVAEGFAASDGFVDCEPQVRWAARLAIQPSSCCVSW